MEFDIQDTIPKGWNTFLYHNESDETHFFVVEQYPDSVSIDMVKTEVMPVFDEGMALLNEGKIEEGYAAFGKLPAYFGGVQFFGGSGLIAPKNTSQTTIHLNPGNFLLECYVKMPNGQFHSSMGMLKEFVVSEYNSGVQPPEEGSIPISISSTTGIEAPNAVEKGFQTFKVTFKDQKAFENFVGPDVNLVRVTPGSDMAALEAWMNWADPKGLITPVPNGFIFLGGFNNSPEGTVGYFSAELYPGTYALISETPSASEKGLLKTFTVSE